VCVRPSDRNSIKPARRKMVARSTNKVSETDTTSQPTSLCTTSQSQPGESRDGLFAVRSSSLSQGRRGSGTAIPVKEREAAPLERMGVGGSRGASIPMDRSRTQCSLYDSWSPQSVSVAACVTSRTLEVLRWWTLFLADPEAFSANGNSGVILLRSATAAVSAAPPN